VAPVGPPFFEKRRHSFGDIFGLQKLATINLFGALQRLIKTLQ
jgi:hypothetical protein